MLCMPSPPHALQKCKDAGFCNRNRGKAGTKFSIDAASIKVEGAVCSASLLNQDAPSKKFALSLIAYDDGFVRMRVDEDPNVGRYQITDVTSPAVESRRTTWSVTQKDGKGATLAVGNATVVLSFQPFRLVISVHGAPAVSINSRDMFNFEHRRRKEVRSLG